MIYHEVEIGKKCVTRGFVAPTSTVINSDIRAIWATPSTVVTSPSSLPIFDSILQLKRATEHISMAYGVRRWTISLFPGIPDLSGTVTTIWPLVGWTGSCVIDLLRRMLFLWKAAHLIAEQRVAGNGKEECFWKKQTRACAGDLRAWIHKRNRERLTKWTRWRMKNMHNQQLSFFLQY